MRQKEWCKVKREGFQTNQGQGKGERARTVTGQRPLSATTEHQTKQRTSCPRIALPS